MDHKRFQGLLWSVVALLLSACEPTEPVRQDAPPAVAVSALDGSPALAPEFNQAPLPDFSQYRDVKAKKQAFFGYMQPMIEAHNDHLRSLREHLLLIEAAWSSQGTLHPDDQQWLSELAELFRADATDTYTTFEQLKRRVNPIPPALVLAQSANESAWGTSRFAREGNNLFGMWCFRPGCGLAPLRRDADASHEVAAYDSVDAGLYHYLINLNANSSYQPMRQIRSCLKQQQRPVTARALAAGLTGYSERGSHYVKELRSMIRINQLEPWSTAWWGNQSPKDPCYPLVQVKIDEPDPLLVATAATPAPTTSQADISQGAVSTATPSLSAEAGTTTPPVPRLENPASSAAAG